MEEELFARFGVLANWLGQKFLQIGTSMERLKQDLPAYHRAILDQINAMEQAYFSLDLEGMRKAEENIRKFVLRAAEKLPEVKAVNNG